EVVVGLPVFGGPHRRLAYLGVHFVVPIGWEVSRRPVVQWVTMLKPDTNLFLPSPEGNRYLATQFLRQFPIGLEGARAMVDRARFRVLLNPVQKRECYGHRRQGTDVPDVLPLQPPAANRDADIPVVSNMPPVHDRWAGLLCG